MKGMKERKKKSFSLPLMGHVLSAEHLEFEQA
jgi:hypothetical protein